MKSLIGSSISHESKLTAVFSDSIRAEARRRSQIEIGGGPER